jgi:hypothetical protein
MIPAVPDHVRSGLQPVNHSSEAPVRDGVSATFREANEASQSWDAVRRVLEAHFHQPDLQAVRVVYSSVAAHKLRGPQVWPMVVGPPGSMKTELLSALDGLFGVHLVDQITPNTFISGQIEDPRKKRTAPSGLLNRIGDQGILICADFSTILGINRNHRASILADLRRIYDGHLRKEFGTSDNLQSRTWSGRITFLVGATPDVDQHYGVFQSLGERFVTVRWARPGGIEAGLRAMNQDTLNAKAELRKAVHNLIDSLNNDDPNIPLDIQLRIAALGELTVRGRTHIPRDGKSKLILTAAEPESNTRLPQQLGQLAKGSALLGGRRTTAEEDYLVARRAALDSIPAVRRKILDVMISGKDVITVDLSPSTRHYVVEDLEALGLLKGGRLSKFGVDLFQKAKIV